MIVSTSSSTVSSYWIAIATGAVGLLGAVSIALFFTVGGPMGALNDLCNALTAVLSAVLIWMLFSGLQEQSPLLSRVLPVVAAVGALLAVVGSVLVLSGTTGWYLAGLYLAVGSGMIGLALLGLNYAAWQSDLLPRGLIAFGLICGVMLALGLVAIPGIFRGIDTQEFEFTALNAVWWTGMLAWLVLYPIWCVLLGRHLLSSA